MIVNPDKLPFKDSWFGYWIENLAVTHNRKVRLKRKRAVQAYIMGAMRRKWR